MPTLELRVVYRRDRAHLRYSRHYRVEMQVFVPNLKFELPSATMTEAIARPARLDMSEGFSACLLYSCQSATIQRWCIEHVCHSENGTYGQFVTLFKNVAE